MSFHHHFHFIISYSNQVEEYFQVQMPSTRRVHCAGSPPNCAQNVSLSAFGVGDFNLPECLVISGGLVGMPIRRVQVKTIYLPGIPRHTHQSAFARRRSRLIPARTPAGLFSLKEKGWVGGKARAVERERRTHTFN